MAPTSYTVIRNTRVLHFGYFSLSDFPINPFKRGCNPQHTDCCISVNMVSAYFVIFMSLTLKVTNFGSCILSEFPINPFKRGCNAQHTHYCISVNMESAYFVILMLPSLKVT